jgi:hypothetical protein
VGGFTFGLLLSLLSTRRYITFATSTLLAIAELAWQTWKQQVGTIRSLRIFQRNMQVTKLTFQILEKQMDWQFF